MADLVRGHYPVSAVLDSLLGQARNATQSNPPVFTNLSFFGASALTDNSTTALTTAKANAVAVAVDYGAIISKVSFVVGATAGATSTHTNVALYSGSVAAPAILGTQSTDNTAANGGFPASAINTVTLGTPVLITPANAPNGYIYVSLGVTATTVPSLLSAATPTAVFYQWSALNSTTANPLGFALTATGGGAVAPATLASASVAAAAFITFLQ
jgi:hypothetical protein